MKRGWLLPAALCLGELLAQEPVDPIQYNRFKSAYRDVDHEILAQIAKELSGSSDRWLQELVLLSQASYSFRSDQIRTCLEQLDSLDAVADKDHTLLRALSLKVRAQSLKRVNAYELAMAAIQRSLQLLQTSDHIAERADVLTNRAEIERKLGQYDEALADLQLANDLCDQTGHDYGKANVLINFGNLHYSQERYPEAWKAYRVCLDFASEHGFASVANNATMNLGAVAQVTGRMEEAIQLYDSLYRAIGRGRPDLRSDLMSNAGFALVKLDRHQEALARFDTAIAINSKAENDLGNAKLYQHRSSSFWALGKKDDALSELIKARNMAAANGWVELEKEVEEKLFGWYKELGMRDEALAAIERYSALNDSISEARFGERMGRMEIQYETEKKDQTIKVQQLELDRAKERTGRRTTAMFALIGALIAVLLFGGLAYRNVQQRKALAEQQRIIADQKVEEVLRSQEVKVMNAMMEGQESERTRIAQDLHDRLGSLLSAIKLQFSAVESLVEKFMSGQRDQFQRVITMLDEAVGEVRRISHNMMSGNLARFGLARALEELVAAVETPGRMHVELNLFGLETRLDQKLEIAVYRMVQEAVGNALKHAQASQLTIQLTRSSDSINVIVEDNGRGFDPATAREGLGMGNIRSRAAEFNGTVHVDTKPGRGTSISVDIPLA